MDQGLVKRRQVGLKLNEQQKQTVRALRRQISSNSTGSSTTESGDHLVAKLSAEELSLLRNVVQTFRSYRADLEPIPDEFDGRTVPKNWSEKSYLPASPEDGTFVNPGRFYVRFTREDVRDLEEVCMELDGEEEAEVITNTYSYRNFDDNSSSLSGYENKYRNYGFSVALTRQNERINLIAVAENTTVEAIPEHFTKKNNFSAINGSVYRYRGKLKYLPPRERFKQAVYLVINNLRMRPRSPRKMDKDFSALWRKRGNATWLSIFFTIVAIAAFFADIGTDLKVAADHFSKGHNYWWGGFTLLLVFIPSAVTNMVSFLWYKEDEKMTTRQPKSGWKIVYVTHFFLVGMVER